MIFLERSPPAIAVATSAMLRTCAVRFDAMKLTLSVRSFQVPATPGTWAWPPSLPSVPTSRATRVTSEANALSWSTMVLMVSFSSRISPRTSTVIFRDRSPRATAVVTLAMLRTCAVRLPHIAFTEFGQILPGAGDAGHDRLAAELAVGADLARHARHFGGKGAQLIDHRVDGFLELQDLAADVDRDLLGEVAIGHRDRDLGDVANLAGQIVGHRVHALGQVLPDARHLRHLGLAAELAFGADLAGDARHLGGEHAELLDHRVDDVGRLQEFAAQRPSFDVELDGLQQVALRHGGDGARNLACRPQEIVDQGVDGAFHVGPGAAGKPEIDALAGLAFATDHLADAFKLLRHPFVGGGDLVEGVRDLALNPEIVAAHARGKIAGPHGLK